MGIRRDNDDDDRGHEDYGIHDVDRSGQGRYGAYTGDYRREARERYDGRYADGDNGRYLGDDFRRYLIADDEQRARKRQEARASRDPGYGRDPRDLGYGEPEASIRREDDRPERRLADEARRRDEADPRDYRFGEPRMTGWELRDDERRERARSGPGFTSVADRARDYVDWERDRQLQPAWRVSGGDLERGRRHLSRWERITHRQNLGPRGYQRSDDRIREEICDWLMTCGIDARDAEVVVKDGEVTLTGTVRSRPEKRAIEYYAEDTLGVRDVHNHLKVRRDLGVVLPDGDAEGQYELTSEPHAQARAISANSSPVAGAKGTDVGRA